MTLDTQASPIQEAEANREVDALIVQIQGALDAAPEPGSLHVGDVLNRTVTENDEKLPLPMVGHTVKSRGYCYLYDSITGEPSLTNVNLLNAQLRKRRADGSLIFTPRQPRVPVRGTHRCLLHPEHPEHAQYEAMGLPTCRKANLTSEFQVEQHMAKRHKNEWAAIQRDRERAKEAEQREYQRKMAEGVTAALAVRTPN